MRQLRKAADVTPYVGVWIETLPDEDYTDAMASLLMWECGLKQSVRPRL